MLLQPLSCGHTLDVVTRTWASVTGLFTLFQCPAHPCRLPAPPTLLCWPCASIPFTRRWGDCWPLLRPQHPVALGSGWPVLAGTLGLCQCSPRSWGTKGFCRLTSCLSFSLPQTAVLNGRVHIRDWRAEKLPKEKHPEAKRTLLSGAFKTRLCWFFTHHPDGCVLPSDCCPFAHGPGELRPPPATKRKKQSL